MVLRREEDPGTDRLTDVAPVRIVAHRSRFEVDFNRLRDQAVYLRAEDAWNMEVWRRTPPDDLVAQSRDIYDEFYAATAKEFDGLAADGPFLVLDLKHCRVWRGRSMGTFGRHGEFAGSC